MPDTRKLAWTVTGLATLSAAGLTVAAGGRIAVGDFLWLGVFAALAALHIVYTRWRPDLVIGLATGSVAVIGWSGAMAGFGSLMALRLAAPLADAPLAAADALLGLHMPDLVAWTAARPLAGWLLQAAYLSSFPLIFATAIFLALTRRADRVWELSLAFAGAITVCTLASAVVPAAAGFAYYDIPEPIRAGLPDGAGVFHLGVFEAYRSGAISMVEIGHLEGVVTFPSFHAAMALMSAYALRGLPVLGPLGYLWHGLVVVATVPIGGHYFIDLFAGAAVWAVFAVLARGGAAESAAHAQISRPTA